MKMNFKYTIFDGEEIDIEDINPEHLKKEMSCNRCWYSKC